MKGKASSERRLAHWLVTGRVQGVGFRWFVQRTARIHDVHGDVRNLPNGRVEVRASGSEGKLAALHAALLEGPPGSRVDGVEAQEPDPKLRFDTFDIRF